jgi:hypothetical protein
MQLVLARAVAQERVVVAAQLGYQAAQAEDEPEDELLVVGVREGAPVGGGCAVEGGFGGGGGTGGPAARVDALRW